MRHITEYTKWGRTQWTGRCSCGEAFGSIDLPLPSRQTVEDLTFAHHRQVEIDRAKIRGTQPKLTTVLAYYREQQENADNSEHDRRMWKQLADEIEIRVGHKPTSEDQPELPLDLTT